MPLHLREPSCYGPHVTTSFRSRHLSHLLRAGAVIVAVSTFAACSSQSESGSPTTNSEPASSTTTVDISQQRLSDGILSYYSKSRKKYLKSIFTSAKADCMAAEYLKIPGNRASVEQSSDPVDYEQLASWSDEVGRAETQRVFWRCLTVPEIVVEVFGENGDCCRDIYPESTLSCLRTELAKMDKEDLITELEHGIMGEPLGSSYAATVTSCGVSLPE